MKAPRAAHIISTANAVVIAVDNERCRAAARADAVDAVERHVSTALRELHCANPAIVGRAGHLHAQQRGVAGHDDSLPL